MSDKNAGVKEGRTRINFIIDNDLLEAMDGIAGIEGDTRTDIMLFLLEEGMERRGYHKRYRKFAEFTPYWLECMAARAKGSFYDGPQPNPLLGFSEEQRDAIDAAKVCGYEDEWGEDYLERRYDPIGRAAEYKRAEKRMREIEKVQEKYAQLLQAIQLDEEAECRELEQKLQLLKSRQESRAAAPGAQPGKPGGKRKQKA